jgi:hypothetical protein
MNVSEKQMNYGPHIAANASVLKTMFGQSESLYCNETLQFEDYNNVVFSHFDPEERQKRRREVFPHDCKRAFELGVKLEKPADKRPLMSR